jgi:aminobenzoyl-glutamate transport protein
VFTAFLSNTINTVHFSGIPLMLLTFIIGALSTFLLPSLTSRWQILSASVVPAMMTSGFTPEAAQLVFTAGSSIAYILTPVMAYYVIYVSYIEKYNKEGTGIRRSISYLLPYAFGIMAMWIIILILFYVIKLPIGFHTGMLV